MQKNMYDSVAMKIGIEQLPNVSFLEELPMHLENVSEHHFQNGVCIKGCVGNLSVSINEHGAKVCNSLCKWYLGNNLQSLMRKDIEHAIQRLSDELHLPMEKAIVTRLDVANNIVVKHAPEVYLNHLGMMAHSTRLVEPNSLYYNIADGRLCFYDKIKEQKSCHEEIPELFKSCNVLRYEQRYTKRLPQHFGVSCVTGAMLYDEKFYMDLLNRWYEAYVRINKINDVSINFEVMKTKIEFSKMGTLCLIEQMGGQLAMLEQIKEAQSKGELSKKQAYDLRKAINDAYKLSGKLTKKSDVVSELDKKMSDMVKFYR